MSGRDERGDDPGKLTWRMVRARTGEWGGEMRRTGAGDFFVIVLYPLKSPGMVMDCESVGAFALITPFPGASSSDCAYVPRPA